MLPFLPTSTSTARYNLLVHAVCPQQQPETIGSNILKMDIYQLVILVVRTIDLPARVAGLFRHTPISILTFSMQKYEATELSNWGYQDTQNSEDLPIASSLELHYGKAKVIATEFTTYHLIPHYCKCCKFSGATKSINLRVIYDIKSIVAAIPRRENALTESNMKPTRQRSALNRHEKKKQSQHYNLV